MNQEQISESAGILWDAWTHSSLIDALPQHCRPSNRSEGYAVQAEIAQLSKQPLFGWKIAATSKDGQKHIGVDGPLAGRHDDGACDNGARKRAPSDFIHTHQERPVLRTQRALDRSPPGHVGRLPGAA